MEYNGDQNVVLLRKFMKNYRLMLFVLAWLLISFLVTSSADCWAADSVAANQFIPYPTVESPASGISWPKGQALPTFAAPAVKLDVIQVQSLTRDEQITFSSLQGQVNRRQPRIFLLDARSDAGRDTWLNTPTLHLNAGRTYDHRDKYDLVAKYADEFAGVVLYDAERSPHYRNVAGTVAGLKHLLPVTSQVYKHFQEKGLELKVVVDLTEREATSPIDIYTHLHETYWPQCEKRFLISARPSDRGGDLHHTRDLAAACGGAIVWLDCQIKEERDVMRKFLADMTPGRAVMLGWYTTERSGITTASEFGIGTLPADHYLNATVYSGGDHTIRIPAVPKMPQLANKTYVAIIISDGDNIQYNQRAMRRLWDRSKSQRGKVPLTWTISPSLVDIGPGLLNYYYDHATPQDCFVSGPSGMGYLIPYNTLTEPGAPIGEFTKNHDDLAAYTQLTATYLQRSGLRAITIWDNLSSWQRKTYETHCRQVYGITVQNFQDVPSVRSSIEGDRLRFEKLVIPYTSTYQHFQQSLHRRMRNGKGDSPQFLAYQVDIWSEMKPAKILEFVEAFEREFPGQIEFVRADHYFNLFNQAHQLPFNLMMHPDTRVSTDTEDSSLTLATDGTPTTVWKSDSKGSKSIQFDLDDTYQLDRLIVRHAGAAGLDPALNTREFSLQTSVDGEVWQTAARVENNASDVTDIDVTPITARHARLVLEDAGQDGTTRIADIELYGKTSQPSTN